MFHGGFGEMQLPYCEGLCVRLILMFEFLLLSGS